MIAGNSMRVRHRGTSSGHVSRPSRYIAPARIRIKTRPTATVIWSHDSRLRSIRSSIKVEGVVMLVVIVAAFSESVLTLSSIVSLLAGSTLVWAVL